MTMFQMNLICFERPIIIEYVASCPTFDLKPTMARLAKHDEINKKLVVAILRRTTSITTLLCLDYCTLSLILRVLIPRARAESQLRWAA